MSAPTTEPAPGSEQDTRPLPVAQRRRVTLGRYIWLSGLIVFPVVPVAAIGTGLLLRTFLAMTQAQWTDVTIAALLIILVGSGVVFLIASRGDDEGTEAGRLTREGGRS